MAGEADTANWAAGTGAGGYRLGAADYPAAVAGATPDLCAIPLG